MLDIQKKLTNSFYAILALPATAMGFALAVQIAALSWILRTEFGLEIYEIGIVWATGPIAGIFGQVIIGVISDNVWLWNGRRRPFIVFGGTLAALMLLSLPNIGVISEGLGIGNIFIVAILVSLTLDLSINVSFNPTRSVIADVTPEGRARTKGYTWMQTVSGFFGVLAYVIGATLGNYVLLYGSAVLVLLFSVIPALLIEEPRYINGEDDSPIGRLDPLLASTISILIPGSGHFYAKKYEKALFLFVLAAAAYVIAILNHGNLVFMILFYGVAAVLHVYSIIDAFREVGKKNRENPELAKILDSDKTDWSQLFKLYIAHGFSWLGVQTMFVYIIFFLEDQLVPLGFENTERMIGVSFAVLNTVGFILPVLVFEPLAVKIGRVKVHTAAIAIMAISYFGMGTIVNTPMTLYVLMAFAGIGWAAIVSLPFAIMSENVDRNRMGFFMGVFNLSVVIPHLIVSLVFGLLVEAFPSQHLLFILCGVMLTISAISWLFVKEKQTGELDIASETGKTG
jgi:maltose/moltooligosaccharide transporter